MLKFSTFSQVLRYKLTFLSSLLLIEEITRVNIIGSCGVNRAFIAVGYGKHGGGNSYRAGDGVVAYTADIGVDHRTVGHTLVEKRPVLIAAAVFDKL